MADQELVAILQEGVQAWNIWKEQNPQAIPDLKETDLSGINLRAANLRLADLRSSNLSRADLSFADLTGAMLHGANLNQTNLGSAHLNSVTLNGATLREADLRRTILNNVYMPSTDLTQAYCHYTVFASIDLSVATGLSAVNHEGPSNIDIRTLYRSHGQIPEEFLRGCGVPEIMITYLPALMETAFDFYSCFISYNHADQDFVERLHDKLQGQGIRCWRDKHDMLPGEDIYEAIDHGILYWDKVLLCCSEQSLTSWWVDDEISRAFDKEQAIMKERGEKVLALVPIDLDGYLFKGYKGAKGKQIRQRVAANFTSWKDHDIFEREVQKVIRALRTEHQKPPLPDPKL